MQDMNSAMGSGETVMMLLVLATLLAVAALSTWAAVSARAARRSVDSFATPPTSLPQS